MNIQTKPRNIFVVVDNDSWILPYAVELVELICELGDKAILCRNVTEINDGFAAFFLGCTQITPSYILKKNQYNLVVHESDLPKGRGFAPVAWQILEDVNNITMCLIEASDDVDAGRIYIKKNMVLTGKELNDEIRANQGKITLELCLEFLNFDKIPEGISQEGQATFYPRRKPKDSELDVEKSILEQFNLFRVVDNERYPAFFIVNGVKYILHIKRSE